MATPQSSPAFDLSVRCVFHAPRDRVFAAWTQREHLGKWMCKVAPDYQAEYLELDVRPGGLYRMRNTSPNGNVYLLRGEYREIRPPEKLAFTWQWEKAPANRKEIEEMGETLVTVEFFERGKETEVVLTHTGFTNADVRGRHEHGWNACFETLAGVL